MKRDELVAYLDHYLGTHAAADYSDNGLQVEGGTEATRLAFAVDACQETIEAAVEGGAQMLIVHHGLFWGKPLPIVGAHRRRVQALLEADCSLYAVHLPLDRHPEVGNNVQLASILGLSVSGWFAESFGVPVGVLADAPPGTRLAELAALLATELGRAPLVVAEGPEEVRRVGIISGGAAREIGAAAAGGCDTFVTGETSHSAFHDAAEAGINVLYAGHYASETVGLHALARHLAGALRVVTTFIDRPTGL